MQFWPFFLGSERRPLISYWENRGENFRGNVSMDAASRLVWLGARCRKGWPPANRCAALAQPRADGGAVGPPRLGASAFFA